VGRVGLIASGVKVGADWHAASMNNKHSTNRALIKFPFDPFIPNYLVGNKMARHVCPTKTGGLLWKQAASHNY
jgi:hypothetical protein